MLNYETVRRRKDVIVMKTLVIVSHPNLQESLNQQFFKEASQSLSITWHHLESVYPAGKINQNDELALLATHERIIFQFPLYWYSAPAHLKIWQDTVLAKASKVLKGKDFGVVVTTGVAEKEYQAGGKEEFTLSEFLRPYQRIAHKFQMNYLPPFVLAQFMYQTSEIRFERLIAYQQYLSLTGKPSLVQRINWFLEQIEKNTHFSEPQKSYLLDGLKEQQEMIEDLTFTLGELKEENE